MGVINFKSEKIVDLKKNFGYEKILDTKKNYDGKQILGSQGKVKAMARISQGNV